MQPQLLQIITVFGVEAVDFRLEDGDLQFLQSDLLFEHQAPLLRISDVGMLVSKNLRLARLQFLLSLLESRTNPTISH